MTSKAASGQCRCCLSSGYHEDIAKYRQVFLDCYNLQLSTNTAMTNNICSYCIHRLYDACEFKAMVVASEGHLLSRINTSNIVFVNFAQDNHSIAQDIIKIKQEDINRNKEEEEDNIVSTKEEGEMKCKIKKCDEKIQDTNNGTIATKQERKESEERRIDQEDDINLKKEREEEDNVAIKEEADGNSNDDQYEEMDTQSDVDEQETEPSSTTQAQPIANNPSVMEAHGSKSDALCLVCGDEATAKHYGAPSCEGCRSFFKRSIRRNLDYVCKWNGCCVVDVTRRKQCPACRFSKCLRVNMRKDDFEPTTAKIEIEIEGEPHGSKQKPFECNMCDKRFPKRYELERHIRTHTGEKPYACKMCDKRFKEKSHLKFHIRQHTGDKPYACNMCDKKFIYQSFLNTHMKSHTGEKPYACNLCDKKFSHSNYLKTHIRKHTGEMPYACNLCDKKFPLPHYLNTHIKTLHTGEISYACKFCDKKFSQMSTLNKHIRTHTGEKPYVCELCAKKFARKCTLSKHIISHTGEKRYACKLCDKKFTESRSLNKHITTHTSETEARMV